MSDITVGFGPDLAETPPWTCSWAVAQNNRSPPGQQKAITTGEGNRLRNPFHTQPAVAARKHGEVSQICGCHLFVGRRDFFFGLLLLYYAPRGCGFEPVQTESGYVHRSEDVCIGSIGNLPTGICVDYFPLETLESNPILEAFTVPVLWVPKAIQTTIPRF